MVVQFNFILKISLLTNQLKINLPQSPRILPVVDVMTFLCIAGNMAILLVLFSSNMTKNINLIYIKYKKN